MATKAHLLSDKYAANPSFGWSAVSDRGYVHCRLGAISAICGDFTLRPFAVGNGRLASTASIFRRLQIVSGTIVPEGNNLLPPQIDVTSGWRWRSCEAGLGGAVAS